MGKRYIVVEEKRHQCRANFVVYKKGWIFNSYVDLFSSKEEAVSFVLSILRKDESYEKVVFDTKSDLKTEAMF